MGWKEQNRNILRRVNIHSFFLEPDTGLGAVMIWGTGTEAGMGRDN